MSSFKANILLLSGTILFSLIAADVILRILDVPVAMPFAIRNPVTDRFQMPDRDVDIALPVDNPEFLAHATTNSIGMLDKEYPLQKPEGVIRGALLGDSFCAAVEVPQKENFHTLLEESLTIGGKRVEFLNFGVRAIGLTQQVQIYRLFAKRFHPDFVLLSVYLANDLTDNQVFYRKGFPDPLIKDSYLHPPLFWRAEYFWRRFNFFLSEHTKIYPFILVRWKIVEQKVNGWYHRNISPLKGGHIEATLNQPEEQPVPRKQPEPDRQSRKPLTEQKPVSSSPANLFDLRNSTPQEEAFVRDFLAKYDTYAQAEEKIPDNEKQAYHAKLIESEPMIVELLLLKALKDELDAEGVKMLLFVFNSKYELDALRNAPESVKSRWLPLYRILFAFCRREGIAAYNLMADFASESDKGKEFFFKTDDHWNVKGQHYVASRLAPFLRSSLSGR